MHVQANWMNQIGYFTHKEPSRVRVESIEVSQVEQDEKVAAVQVRQGGTQDILVQIIL